MSNCNGSYRSWKHCSCSFIWKWGKITSFPGRGYIWGLKLCSRKTRLQLPELKLQNGTIDYVPRVRYLRVISDRRLNWAKHYEALRGKALRILAAIKPLLGSSLCLKSKLLINKSYINPVNDLRRSGVGFPPKIKTGTSAGCQEGTETQPEDILSTRA